MWHWKCSRNVNLAMWSLHATLMMSQWLKPHVACPSCEHCMILDPLQITFPWAYWTSSGLYQGAIYVLYVLVCLRMGLSVVSLVLG